MDEDSPSESPLLGFVEAGMQLTYVFQSIGQLKTLFGQTVDFFPVFRAQGFPERKEFTASLRLEHCEYGGRIIGRCSLDRDEIVAWSRHFREMQDHHGSGLMTKHIEYVSRHGIALTWDYCSRSPYGAWMLHVASSQSASFSSEFVTEMLAIFDEFRSLCDRYT